MNSDTASVSAATVGMVPGGRAAEPRQIDRDHLALGGERLEHRLERLPEAADAMDQQQRLPRART
jgi:hypothetical protein